MDKTTSSQKKSIRPDSPIKNSDLAPKSNKENNDFLPVSVAFKPRKPSSSRLASEIQRHEEEKRIEVEHARLEELKKYTHLALATPSKAAPTRGANANAGGSSANDAVSQRLSEIASHREVMVAQEHALARAEDRVRKGKNRANEAQPDLAPGVERVPIKFGGNNKRDYSYIKEPVVAEPAAEVTTPVKSAPAPALRPASGGPGRARRITSGGGSSRPDRGSDSGSGSGKLVNIILDSSKNAAEQSKDQDLELQGVFISRDQTHLSEDERNIAEFLRAKKAEVALSFTSTSTSATYREKDKDEDKDDAVSAKYTTTFSEGNRLDGPTLDGGGMPLSLTRGIASPGTSSRAAKYEIASISDAIAIANLQDEHADIKAVSVSSANLFFAPQPMRARTHDTRTKTKLPAYMADSDVHVQDTEFPGIEDVPVPTALVAAPTPNALVATSGSREQNMAYSPDSSIESTQDIPGEVSPAHKGGVFSQPSVVVGENGEAPTHSESSGIGLNLKKYVQTGKKGGSASITSKYTGKNLSGLIINSTSVNLKSSVVNVNAALAVVKEEGSVADLRSSPLLLQQSLSESERGAAANSQGLPTTNVDAEAVTGAGAGTGTHLREKFNHAISLDQQVNENGSSGATNNRIMGSVATKLLRAQTAAHQPLRVTGTQTRPHSANGALLSSDNRDGTPTAQAAIMSTTGNNNNIIAKNLQAAGTHKFPVGNVNARLTASFRSEIGEPTEKDSAIKALKERGRTTPLERMAFAGLVNAGKEAILPKLAIDDSCLLSPAPQTLTFSASKGKIPPHFVHSPSSEVLLQQISEAVQYVENVNPAVRYSPADAGSGVRGAEFQLFTDIHNTIQSVKEVYEQKRNSPTDSPDRPRSPVLAIPSPVQEAHEASAYKQVDMMDSLVVDSLNVSLVLSLQEAKSVNWPVNEAEFEPNAAELSETVLETLSTQTRPTSGEEALEKKVQKSSFRHTDVSNASLLHSFPSVRLEGVPNSANMSTMLLDDSLTGSVLGMLSTVKSGVAANNTMLSLSPFPAASSIGVAPSRAYDTFGYEMDMGILNAGKKKASNQAVSTVTKATPASKAKMKIRGIESSAAEYTTLEEKRHLAKYSWMQLQKRLQLGQERSRRSTAAKINETMTTDKLVHEPAEHILDFEVMQCFDTLQQQCDKFAHIANEDITQEDIEHILHMHEKAKRSEARYEQRLHQIERKHQRRVREVVEKSGLREDDLVYPGIHIPVSESKEEKQDKTNHIVNIYAEDAIDQNALMLAKKENKRSRKSRSSRGKSFDALNKDKEVFIGDHHMDNMDHDAPQGILVEDYHAPIAQGAVTTLNLRNEKLDLDKSKAAIAESVELSTNFAIGMAESTFVAAKSFEVLDSVNLQEVAFHDASGAIAIGASALEASLDFGMDNRSVLEKVDSQPRSERGKFPLTFLFNDSQTSADFKLDEGGSSVFKDSVYSYSRNQTQTIHAPAAHGSMLRAGVGIQRNKPGYVTIRKTENAELQNIGPIVRPRPAAATSSRPQQQPFFDSCDVDNTLDQSFSFGKLKISGKGAANNVAMPAASTLEYQAAPEPVFTDAYSINNAVSYKSNIPSIRDTRMQEREKHFYKQEQLLRSAGHEPPASGRSSTRPSTAGTARATNTASAPKAAEVGLRMVNWKYGSLVRVDGLDDRDGNQTFKKSAAEKIGNNNRVATDDEFVASALLKGSAEYLAENSMGSDMWCYQSFQASQLFDSLLNKSKDISGDKHELSVAPSAMVKEDNDKHGELNQERSTRNKSGRRSSRNISESTKRPIRMIPSSYFNVDSNTPAPQSRMMYPSDYIEKELRILQVSGGQPILTSSRRNY